MTNSARRRRELSPAMIQSIVGLMLIASLGALGFLAFWIKDIRFGQRGYNATFIFSDAAGMLPGTRVDYRGVRVGRVVSVVPEPGGVALNVEINPADRIIPSNSVIEAKQSGLIGETSINIVPQEIVAPDEVTALPLDKDCDRDLIICNGSRLRGEDALDVNSLIRSMMRISNFFTEPEIVNAMRAFATKTPQTLNNITALSGEAASLLKKVNQSGSVRNLNSTLQSIDRAASDLSTFSNQATTILQDARQSGTIDQLNATLASTREAARQVQVFMAVNQNRVGTTLNSIQATSDELRVSVRRIDPQLQQVLGQFGTTAGRLDTTLGQLESSNAMATLEETLRNLNTVSINAKQLTENLNNFSVNLNDPTTLLTLQQLLDSARAAFQNIQKITSDVDQITGNPALRQEIIRLIKGLSGLVSTTEYLQKQIQYAQSLNKMSADLAVIAQSDRLSFSAQQPASVPVSPAVPTLRSPQLVNPASKQYRENLISPDQRQN
ncbi:MAG: MlaD family protein [Snowella sp.]|nr:MlaD family protein [Snowella sp.]